VPAALGKPARNAHICDRQECPMPPRHFFFLLATVIAAAGLTVVVAASVLPAGGQMTLLALSVPVLVVALVLRRIGRS
jgi:hypothetical protein